MCTQKEIVDIKWEYKVLSLSHGNLGNGGKNTLDKLGANSWELISVDKFGNHIFKRQYIKVIT